MVHRGPDRPHPDPRVRDVWTAARQLLNTRLRENQRVQLYWYVWVFVLSLTFFVRWCDSADVIRTIVHIFLFFPILSLFYVRSVCLMRCLHLAQSCASSPDNSLSDKSFFMLSNHLRFGLHLLLSPAPPSPPLSCLRIRLLFSIHAPTTSTYFPALCWIFLPPSLFLEFFLS